ncbi:MAG: cytochrome P450 [Myxococcota bacterium]
MRRGIPAAVEEMLRFESPVQSLARRSRRDVVLHGATIPAGSEVRLLWGAANRDEREFERPDAFEIERPIRRHLAFGHGIHFCLGAGLARLEARIAFEEILARWPEHEIELDALERLPSLWVRAWERVPIRLR